MLTTYESHVLRLFFTFTNEYLDPDTDDWYKCQSEQTNNGYGSVTGSSCTLPCDQIPQSACCDYDSSTVTFVIPDCSGSQQCKVPANWANDIECSGLSSGDIAGIVIGVLLIIPGGIGGYWYLHIRNDGAVGKRLKAESDARAAARAGNNLQHKDAAFVASSLHGEDLGELLLEDGGRSSQ